MACRAEVRVYDPLSQWECYIYALNPEDEDEICCILCAFSVEITRWTLSELSNLFNSEGERVQVDQEYRPRYADNLYKILKQGLQR